MKRFLVSSSETDESPWPPPPLPAPKALSGINRTNHVSPVMAVTICALGASFLLFTYLTLRKKYNYSNPSNSTRRNRNQPTFDDAQVDFVDENRGPIIHPIWYINTVGLQQSAIDSISVFKYRKDGGLIEGTDCSVCLTEFEDDESLRLLPKCSHAFHIPCIDTWLRSHTNCPVCRAPVVCENAQANAPESNLNDSGLAEEAPADNINMENRVESERSDGMGDFGGLPSEEGAIYGETKSCEFEVLSGLADRLQTLQEELPPVRRSVSMDDSSAQRIYREVANVPPVQHEGCSSNQSGQVQRLNSEKAANDIRRNVILSRLMKSPSPSIGFSLQKGPVAMKRSLSSASGKFSFPRRISRSQEPILPL